MYIFTGSVQLFPQGIGFIRKLFQYLRMPEYFMMIKVSFCEYMIPVESS